MEKFPIFKYSYITEDNDEITKNFTKYINYTNKLVEEVQNNSKDAAEIPLTFYPIAKNIRIPSSYMAINILHGKSSYIKNMARVGEENFWKYNMNMVNWFPWLWSRGRIAGNYTNIDGWKYYFDSFAEKKIKLSRDDEFLEPPNNLILFFTYLSCIKYTFELNDNYKKMMNNYKIDMNWPEHSKVLAIQIRRGDSATKDGSVCNRPFFHLQKYIEKAEILINEHGYEYIYISTDSNEEIDVIKQMKPEWKLLYLPIDRSNFFRMADKIVDLEVFCSNEPEKIPFIVDSGIADLYFISMSQGYVSTISISEFSRCGWYLQIATQTKITPYYDIIEQDMDMSKRDMLLLL